MNNVTRNTVKYAMEKIQEVIDLFEKIEGNNQEVDAVAESLGFSFADLEYEINK